MTGYAVNAGFLRSVSRQSYLPFVVYRLLLGGIVMALVEVGHLPAV